MSIRTATHLYVIQWGYRGDELNYASFVGERFPVETVKGIVRVTSSGYFVRHPDGTTHRISDKDRLFEQIDGRYREVTQKVSLAEFSAFTKSKPPEYSIDELIRFVNRQRGNGK